jgi:hypothetical protein
VASFPISIGGRGCTLKRTVGAPSTLAGEDIEDPSSDQGAQAAGLASEPLEIRKDRMLTPMAATLKVFPNPSEGLVNIQVRQEALETVHIIRIMDAMGRQIGILNSVRTGDYTFDLTGKPSGIYYFILFDMDGKPVGNRQLVLK